MGGYLINRNPQITLYVVGWLVAEYEGGQLKTNKYKYKRYSGISFKGV